MAAAAHDAALIAEVSHNEDAARVGSAKHPSSMSVVEVCRHVLAEWKLLSRREAVGIGLLMVLLYVSSAMQIFGQNFWMWSFTKGNPNYVAMVVPAAIWAVCFATPLLVYQMHTKIGLVPLLQSSRRPIALLALIGLLDSLGGLTSIYSVVHVPVLLQTVFYAVGPVWTYGVSCMVYPASVRPVNRWIVLVVLLIAGSVVLALMPQLDAKNGVDLKAGWVVVFFVSAILPPTYNVVQGRFLSELSSAASPIQAKLVLLAGDTSFQLFFTIFYFPLDATPWFGSSPSLAESWSGMVEAFKCIAECENNVGYLLLYAAGFWLNHVVFAFLNLYSPTVGALLAQLCTPINTFLLVMFPAWNVYGAPVSVPYNLGCFVLLLVSIVTYGVWHIGTPAGNTVDASITTRAYGSLTDSYEDE